MINPHGHRDDENNNKDKEGHDMPKTEDTFPAGPSTSRSVVATKVEDETLEQRPIDESGPPTAGLRLSMIDSPASEEEEEEKEVTGPKPKAAAHHGLTLDMIATQESSEPSLPQFTLDSESCIILLAPLSLWLVELI